MHHNILNNPFVRLLDVHIPPGDTTQFHVHETASVFIILQSVRTGSQVIQEENHSDSPILHYGNIWFEGFYVKSRIHRVWNSDTSEFHVMDIELPNRNYRKIDPPFQNSLIRFLFEEKPVRVSRMKLPGGSVIDLPLRKADILIIQLSDSAGQSNISVLGYKSLDGNRVVLLKKGDYGYIQSGNRFYVRNEGDQNAEFAILELK